FPTDTVDGMSRTVLSFQAGNGLALVPTTDVISSNNYSIVMLFKFSAAQDNWRRILDFRDSATAPTFSDGDNGLYADPFNQLAFIRQRQSAGNIPGNTNLITAGKYVQVVVTRD